MTRTGTAHFVRLATATAYYARQGIPPDQVAAKLAAGEIFLGPPTLRPGQRLTTIDGGTRYAIEESTPARILNRDDTRETFRRHVLAALDQAARETFDPPRNDAGASDADLPRLFAALDAQIETLAERYGTALVD